MRFYIQPAHVFSENTNSDPKRKVRESFRSRQLLTSFARTLYSMLQIPSAFINNYHRFNLFSSVPFRFFGTHLQNVRLNLERTATTHTKYFRI